MAEPNPPSVSNGQEATWCSSSAGLNTNARRQSVSTWICRNLRSLTLDHERKIHLVVKEIRSTSSDKALSDKAILREKKQQNGTHIEIASGVMKMLQRLVGWLGKLLPRRNGERANGEVVAFKASPTKSLQPKDSSAEGPPLKIGVDSSVNRDLLRKARDAACDSCDEAFRGMQVHPEHKLLMMRLHDVQSVLSASNVSYKQLRAELIVPDCVFRRMSWADILGRLRRMKRTVSDSQVDACRKSLREDFDCMIVRSEAKIEKTYVQDCSMFIFSATSRFTGGNSARMVRALLEEQSAARGPLSRRKRATNQVDEDAGYRGKTDLKLKFGHPSYHGKTLLVGEAKFRETRPNMARPWWEMESNHLPELMESMIGQLALLGVAFNNYGMKAHLIDTPDDGGASTFFCSPPGPLYLDFSKPEELEMAFEFWVEVAVLAVPPAVDEKTNNPAHAVPVSVSSAGSQNNTTDAKPSPAHAGRKRSKPETGANEEGVAKKQTRSIWTLTPAGERLEFTSIDLKEEFNQQELKLLDAQFEKERNEMGMETEGGAGEEKDPNDASTHEPSTPWFTNWN